MKKNFWLQLSKICFFLLCIAIGEKTFATEPLHDQYVAGAESGWIFPSQCCWMKLPPSERLTTMKKAEVGCSAIGGPVGKFKLESGKLWLTGLLKCGGEVSLREVYPDFESPALANWLTGTFKTQVGFLCYDNSVRPIYSVKQVLTIDQGVVTSLSETKNDTSVCSKNTGS
ncbi:hypothetical protein [Massilia sp. DWR3-1-1]|uniref:hypothetical protein n=1 Tax=Massilia sp. DWR3-1-1 TaxID=2804559 RepID=UPI003CEB4051